MAEDSDAAEAAEAARAQAEARRKRILEKADTRLGVVSGEQVQDEEAKKQSSIRAARLRAARQRRYGKKTPVTTESQKEEPAASSTWETDEGPKAMTETASETKEENPSEATPKEETVQEVPGEAATVSTEAEGLNENESPKEQPKKKYLGVAKMRRKMILKKKIAEAEDSSKLHSPLTKTDTDLPLEPLATQVVTLPIYMYIVTILLLFFAGVDVGLQQYHEDVKIHNNLALNEYGIPFIHRNPWKDNRSDSGLKLLQVEPSSKTQDTFQDEFEEDLDEQDYVPNIDPVFGVDLDEVTKGPGLLNQLARGAIAVHRLVLMLVYYTPRNILQTLVGIPRALMQTPPALCLLALILRQLVGKMILKAGVPVLDVEEKDSAIDVLAMVKQWVTKFMSSTFPTAVGVYDVFVHLRSDMYIVICGVFCGMAWTHMSQYSHIAVEGPAAGGATDEL
jgi:hypothetical protein